MPAQRLETPYSEPAQATPGLAERRREGRVHPHEPVTFQITWSKDNPASRSRPLFGSGIDLSADGVQLSLDFPIPIGHTLHLWVELPERGHRFFLTGCVRWTGQVVNEAGYRVGVELHDHPDTDKDRWNGLFG